jgi:hypothetical protein
MLASFKREALHLEMRDAYGTEAEIPHLRKWIAGEQGDPSRLEPRFDGVRAGVARVVSEPVTDAIRLCRSAFDSVWKFSIPNSEYQSG